MTQSKTPRGPAHCRGPAIIKNPRRGTKHTRRQPSPHFKPTATPARGPAQAKAPLQTSKCRHRDGPRQKRKESKSTEGPTAGPHITSTKNRRPNGHNQEGQKAKKEAEPNGTPESRAQSQEAQNEDPTAKKKKEKKKKKKKRDPRGQGKQSQKAQNAKTPRRGPKEP